MTDEQGKEVIRCYVKGAPDQLLARATTAEDGTGQVVSIEGAHERILAENERLARQGLRVMATARRDLDPATFDPAADLLPLVSLATPRTDAPVTLVPVADDLPPLDCGEEDDETGVILRMNLAEMKAAQVDGIYRRKQVREAPVDRAQIGFIQVALLRVLQDAAYPDRQQWIEDFRRIRSNLDAAIFMTEAKLKLRYGADVKKEARLAAERLRPQRDRAA
jgi:hypothetical protein